MCMCYFSFYLSVFLRDYYFYLPNLYNFFFSSYFSKFFIYSAVIARTTLSKLDVAMSRVLEHLAERAVSIAMYCTAHATGSINVNKVCTLHDESSTNVLVRGKLHCAKDAHYYLSMTCNALCKLAKQTSRASDTMQVHKFFCDDTNVNC